jgi:hypothetical protein
MSVISSITVSIYELATFETIKELGQLFAESALSLYLFNLPVRSSVKRNLVEHENGRYRHFRNRF